MKRFATITSATIAGLFIVGMCASCDMKELLDSPEQTPSTSTPSTPSIEQPIPFANNYGLYEKQVLLRDGRKVTCITYVRGGVSCDWASATK